MDDRERIQHALRESEGRFRLLVESVQDYGIFMLDPEGRIISWNRGAERIKGYTEKEVRGRHFSLFYTPADVDRRYPEFELEVAARKGRYEDEGWRVRKDGARFWANVVITALRDPAGELVGFAKVTRDLTERRKAEAEREELLVRELEARRQAEQLTHEVLQQASRLEKQTAALEVASRAKSEFLATMSHELRTPINAILGYVDLLEMGISGPVTEEQQLQLGRVRASGQHLVGLISDILDLATAEAGRITVGRKRSRAVDTIVDALSLVAPHAAEKGIQIPQPGTEDSTITYVGDEQRVRQVLVNLLSNAIKFTDAGGDIRITCGTTREVDPDAAIATDGPVTYIRVRDTGIGIPPEEVENIFRAFTQVETGHTRTHGGTGLGLTISRHLARLMGGDLTVESHPGVGSTFTVWLPSDAGPREDAVLEEVGDAPPPGAAVVGEALQAGIETVLRRYAGRLRSAPEIPRAGELGTADLVDHGSAFLADLAQSLVALEKSRAVPQRLLRDGGEIQRVIADLHGRQRARLGWTEEALRREYRILREEVEAGVQRTAPQDADVAGALRLLARFMERAEGISLRSFRDRTRRGSGEPGS